ncbi:MAG TPA: hypothetical protein VFU49_21290 [Ktedonobacteraceae bacterium]|nr:hypothetical protein [Ktedonobacteraceae bacterium]
MHNPLLNRGRAFQLSLDATRHRQDSPLRTDPLERVRFSARPSLSTDEMAAWDGG